ncbi:hypothetical protein K458DRAFT_396942 [Lentithecium fluviatile CBS 122367]|uniref:BTB domain-containing protein n=1 Tax=Lentithecium fluviatile CBS 122367 TaxID=1168545 RepID=A0A6G1IEE8_9PLEO|nr:hypothetical protein K458DRAFT_396942 [Lentithecium fluviatile CBS 122367]
MSSNANSSSTSAVSEPELSTRTGFNTSRGTASDYYYFTLKCGSEEWKIHGCIGFPGSNFFAGTVHSAQYLEVPDNECDIISHPLHFLYTSDYDVDEPKQSAQELTDVHLRFYWDLSHDDLTPNPNATEAQHAWIKSPDISPAFANGLLEILEAPASRTGIPFLRASDTAHLNLLLHAKVSIMAKKYEIQGLRALALHKLVRGCTGSVTTAHAALQYLMTHSPATNQEVREIIAKEVFWHVDTYGWNEEIVKILEEYPVLYKYTLRTAFEWCSSRGRRDGGLGESADGE